MADDKSYYQRISWDGGPQGWPGFVRRVRLIFEKTKRNRHHHSVPEIVAQLTGRAWHITEDLDHKSLVRRNRTIYCTYWSFSKIGSAKLRFQTLDCVSRYL